MSLFEQSRPPERVIVVADNCTDHTARIARRHGAEVVETIGNTQKKAVRRHGRRAETRSIHPDGHGAHNEGQWPEATSAPDETLIPVARELTGSPEPTRPREPAIQR